MRVQSIFVSLKTNVRHRDLCVVCDFVNLFYTGSLDSCVVKFVDLNPHPSGHLFFFFFFDQTFFLMVLFSSYFREENKGERGGRKIDLNEHTNTLLDR